MVDAIEAAIFGKNVTDNLVYHYTTRETALEKILPSGKIMLNVLEKTNDPREYIDRGVTVTGGSDDTKPFWKAVALVKENRKDKTKVLCLTMDDTKHQRFGLMRRGFARSRMWAQYGENHAGMCLVFDKKALEAEIEKIAISTEDCYFGPVVYTDQDFGIELNFNTMGETEANIQSGVDLYIRKNIQSLFFTKLLDWRDEMEYRAMVYDDRKEAVFSSITNCLKGIVLGHKFPVADIPLVQEYGRKYGSKVGQLQWPDGIPSYVNPLGREKG